MYKRFLIPALVVAAVVALAAGVGSAAIPDANGTFHACVWTSTARSTGQVGKVRIIDLSKGQRCSASEAGITWNRTGVQGPQGSQGPQGGSGPSGPQGAQGPPWTPSYGNAAVLVSRGGHPAAVWATYSTTLGNTVGFGDNTGGVFRFTCSAANAPCVVSIQGEVSGGATSATMYPRLLIYKSDINTGQIFGQCEYADGADNSGTYGAIGTSWTPVTMGIGQSLDCGSSQAYPSGGTASTIEVPAGYYDVQSTFYFK